jgi:putative peptide zinc metalloprotease protein
LIEIPNLRQKASDILNRKLAWWCLGIESPDDPFLPQRNQIFFAAYSVAAAIYRWIVALSIVWFLYQVWKPYRLEVIGQIIAMAALYGLLVQPLWKVAKFFWVPGRINKVKKPRLYATLAVLGLVVAGFFLIPLPNRVFCTFEIQPQGASPVYVDVPGELQQVNVHPGQQVEAGFVLAELQNRNVDFEVTQLDGQKSEYSAQYDATYQLASTDREAGGQLSRIEASRKSVAEQLEKRQQDLELLKLKAPKAGIVMLPPETQPPPDTDENLPGWSGTPLEPKNLGCTLEEAVMFCQIGDPTKMQAVLVIPQGDMEFVRKGQDVELKLDSRPGDTLPGQIDHISNVEMKVSPRNLSNKYQGELATETDETGQERPLETSYQVTVPIDDPQQMLVMGLKGRAKIYAGKRTLAQQVWRYVARTFNFEL